MSFEQFIELRYIQHQNYQAFQLIFQQWLRLISTLLSFSDLYCDIIQKVSVCLHRMDLNIRMNTFCVYSWHWKNLVPVCSVLSNSIHISHITIIQRKIAFMKYFLQLAEWQIEELWKLIYYLSGGKILNVCDLSKFLIQQKRGIFEGGNRKYLNERSDIMEK